MSPLPPLARAERGLAVWLPEALRMIQIRTNHPYGFRSGQWAVLLTHGIFKGNSVYVVRFPDGAVDLWRVDDPAGDYESREKA